jgi:hypothetical protein
MRFGSLGVGGFGVAQAERLARQAMATVDRRMRISIPTA